MESSKRSAILQSLLVLKNEIQLFHWQTFSYPKHVASGNLYTILDDKIDSFVEAYMGKYSRPLGSFKIKIRDYIDDSAEELLHNSLDIVKFIRSHLDKKDTDLFNILDEIDGALHKSLYLFTLN